jgi:hypothetical protein
VQVQLLVDLCLQCLDLLDQGDQHPQQGASDMRACGAFLAARAAWGGLEVGQQRRRGLAATVADAFEPGGQAALGAPVSVVLGSRTGPERPG